MSYVTSYNHIFTLGISFSYHSLSLTHTHTFTHSQAVEETAKQIMGRVPKPLPLSDIMEQYPVKYEESMNTVLVQEVYIQYKHKSIITMEAVYRCMCVTRV